MAGSHGMSRDEFTLLAIQKFQGRSKKFPTGIHVVFSGFNEAYRRAFPGADPVTDLNEMAAMGTIELRVCRGGAVIYRPGEAPVRRQSRRSTAADDVLNAVLGDSKPPAPFPAERCPKCGQNGDHARMCPYGPAGDDEIEFGPLHAEVEARQAKQAAEAKAWAERARARLDQATNQYRDGSVRESENDGGPSYGEAWAKERGL